MLDTRQKGFLHYFFLANAAARKGMSRGIIAVIIDHE